MLWGKSPSQIASTVLATIIKILYKFILPQPSIE